MDKQSLLTRCSNSWLHAPPHSPFELGNLSDSVGVVVEGVGEVVVEVVVEVAVDVAVEVVVVEVVVEVVVRQAVPAASRPPCSQQSPPSHRKTSQLKSLKCLVQSVPSSQKPFPI